MEKAVQSIITAEMERLPLDVLRGRNNAFLEIGFGNGEFLVHLAREDTQSTYWGIEMSKSCVVRARKRIAAEALPNAHLLCGDARFFLRECCAAGSLDGIYMNFPCPWPKKRHSKRRVSSGSFPSEVARVLKDGGFFELLTDEEWYGREVLMGMTAHPHLEEGEWRVNPPRPFTTKYERKWLEMGKSIFLSKIEKKTCRSGENPEYLGRAEDVHVRVMRKGPAGNVLKNLFGREEKLGEGLWIYKKCYSDGTGSMLLEVVTMDGDFEQKFFLLVLDRQEDILVKVAPHSSPFLTPAVRGAITTLAAELERSCG